MGQGNTIEPFEARFRETVKFLDYLVQRFARGRCAEVAASLTFTSLLAMVPVMALSFAVLSAFPVFQAVEADVQSFLFSNFLPHTGEVVAEYLTTFTRNAGRLTLVGLILLGITALMLLSTIEGAFNRIWRVEDRRPAVLRILAFWTIMTLGPVLFGLSLSLSSYLFTAAKSSGVEAYTGPLARLAPLVPPVLTFIGFTALYIVIPNRPVRWRHAAAGALLAAILFESLKKGFGLYVTAFPTYQTIYGAISVIPILLVWIYLSWTVALIGAVFAAALPEWRTQRQGVTAVALSPIRRLMLALAILAELYRAYRSGERVRHRQLLERLPGMPDEVEATLKTLIAKTYIAPGRHGIWLLARDLNSATLYDLRHDLGLSFAAADLKPEEPWEDAIMAVLRRVDQAQLEVMDIALADLLPTSTGLAEPAVRLAASDD